MKKLVVVLGMHRSGTSMVTQLCQCMGTYLGEENELMPVTKDNPDGYFEKKEIAFWDDVLLRACHREWYSLENLDLDYNCTKVKKTMEELKECMKKLLEKCEVTAIKDPRISILLPIWEKIFDELNIEIHYIWVFRNPLEVADSLKKRDGYSRKHSLLLWIHYNLSILKFLKGKNYLLINYGDILNDIWELKGLSELLDQDFSEELRQKLGQAIKKQYRHSNYSDQIVQNKKGELSSEIYCALSEKSNLEESVLDWESRYKKEITYEKAIYLDYQVLRNAKCLCAKRIIIYGAGNYGQQAAGMLQQLGGFAFDFCDKDTHKQGTDLMGGRIFSVTEIEELEDLCIIIAVENQELKKEIEHTLQYIRKVSFLSFFALKKAWKYFVQSSQIVLEAEALSSWYRELMVRAGNIKLACKNSILVYQNGKVGSSTISRSLQVAGIENAHIHRFFYKNDVVGELLLGQEQREFIRNSNIFRMSSTDYVKDVKEKIKGKKIITMVRDPIAVDLSTVFEWMGAGVTDRYFSEQLKCGKDYLQIVMELMLKIRNRLFDWFAEELKELSGIDIFSYPFDKEKGYALIRENDVEILLLKAEMLSQTVEVIRGFIGNDQIELVDENVGKKKEYAYIYEEVKKELELPKEYMEYYYVKNPYMDHFYSEAEKKVFESKWKGI